MNGALGALLGVLGPLGAGLAYDHVMAGSPYWLGALVLGLACLLIARVSEPARRAAVVAESRA